MVCQSSYIIVAQACVSDLGAIFVSFIGGTKEMTFQKTWGSRDIFKICEEGP